LILRVGLRSKHNRPTRARRTLHRRFAFAFIVSFCAKQMRADKTILISPKPFHDVDLIVIGTHGRRGNQKRLLGSVTEEIFRQATRPVLTVGPEICPPREGVRLRPGHELLILAGAGIWSSPSSLACCAERRREACASQVETGGILSSIHRRVGQGRTKRGTAGRIPRGISIPRRGHPEGSYGTPDRSHRARPPE
jgi:hypothetical protein